MKWKKFDVERLYRYKIDNSKALMLVLIFIIVPLLSSLALGYEMKFNQIQSIPTVIVDHDNSEFSRTLTTYIGENEIFKLLPNPESDKEVETMIQEGKAMVGVIIPASFSSDLREGNAPKVLICYDGSMMSVVSAAKSRMSEILITAKSGFLKQVYEGKLNTMPSESLKQVMPIDATYRVLYNPTKNYRNFMLPGMLMGIIQVGITMVGVARGQDQWKGYFSMLKSCVFWGCMGAVSIVLTLGVQYVFFGMPYRGSLLAGLVLSMLFSICMFGFGMIVGRIIKDKVFATQVACVLVLPTSILGGYTFPLMAMPMFFQKLGKLIAFSYFSEAVRNLSLKEIGFFHLKESIVMMIIFIGIEWLILCGLWYGEKLYEKARSKTA